MSDYENITNPYDGNLARQPGGLAFATGGQNTDSSVAQQSQTSAQAGGNSAASSNAGNGSAQQASVASGGAIADITIEHSIQSKNWSPKKVGFYIDGQTGYAEFSKVFVSGEIEALTGEIGGWTIGVDSIQDTSGATGMSSAVTAGDDIRFWAGDVTPGSAEFRVYESGALVASSATITGAITATTGAIGGFIIGADYIKDTADTMGLASTVTAGDDVRGWAGATFANRATAPYRWTEAGAVTMANATITGGSIIGAGIVSVIALNLANRGWTQTCAFSVTNATTVAWGAGSFVTADGGTTLSISAGSTSSMAVKTYIYLDANISLTAYQITTTPTTAVGASKVLIAIAQNGTVEATYTVLAGQGGQNIDASNIVANSITGNELSGSIIYAGSIQVDTSGNIRSGQTAYETGTGWFIGNSGGTAKLSMGSPTNYIKFDGTILKIKGSFDVGSGGIINNSSYTVANLPVVPTVVGYNVASAYE